MTEIQEKEEIEKVNVNENENEPEITGIKSEKEEKEEKENKEETNLENKPKKPEPAHSRLIENQALVDHYKTLINYKNNMMKLDALIHIESDEEQINTLNKLRQDLLGAINYEEGSIKALQNNEEFFFSVEVLIQEYVDRLCKTYFEADNRWYHAKIESVDADTQEADVSYIGYKNSYKVHAMFIKLIPKPNIEALEPGSYIEAIYSGDGHYYPCIVEKVSEEGIHVKFKKYNNRELVTIYHLRESRSNPNDITGKKRNFEDLTEFKMPEHLRILPNDSEIQRLSKKKKIKKLKQAFKSQLIEKDSKEKQGKWNVFNDFAEKNKKGHYQIKKNAESIFKSPDTIEGKVGVMGSGKGMTNFNPRTRYSINDNSHLSRLF